jgi:hypothetical protein
MVSLRFIPSSSRIGCSSFRYSSYCILFSTFALMPVKQKNYVSTESETIHYPMAWQGSGVCR